MSYPRLVTRVPAQRPEDCLAGGGEMGELIRSLDWSATPVGPVASWPQSLRTAVSILLDSRFPMYIAWGREYVQFYNDYYRPILGSTKHPAIGRTTRETFPESWHIIGPMFDDVMRGVATGSEDWMLPLDRHGYLEECYFTFSYSPIRDESGGVGGVHVTVTETTERVLGERRLRTLRDLAAGATAATGEDEAWANAAEALAGNPHDLPFVLLYALDEGNGDGGTLRRVGRVGIDADHPAGPPELATDGGEGPWPLAAGLAGATEVADLRERLGELTAGEWPEPIDRALLLPISRPGRPRPYGLLVAGTSPRRALDDAYRGFLGLVADQLAAAVANARAYEEERRRAAALAELDRAKTLFFNNVSHEFRTPLTLLLGPAEDLLAGRSGELGAGPREAVEVVHRNGLRLLRLVNTLLDFARLEAGRIDARYRPLDLARATADLASVFRSGVERAGLAYEVDVPPLPEPVWVDREMWEKVVSNLLSNALKFTFEGSVRVRLRPTDEGAELTVADTGVGIPAAELPHLFERFHRVEGTRARSQEGTGIGLALVHDLVALHGGTIEVESEEGRGTTFAVRLPWGSAHLPEDRLVEEVEPDGADGVADEGEEDFGRGAVPFVEEALRWLPAGEASAGDTATADRAAARERILLADDNADMREYVERLLAPRWRVETVADGEAALAAALADPPDLVLSDVMMPGLDGFELVRRLRADERTRSLPVVLLSARAGEDERVEGLERGADDYLVKPFSARELVARVATHLQVSRLRRQVDGERRRLETLFMQAPAVIAVTRGPEHVFELSNPRHRELVGRDVVGLPVREALPELEGTDAYEILDRVYATGRPHVAQEFVATVVPPEGEPREGVFDWVSVPVRDLEGEVTGIMIFVTEVTGQVEARRAAEEASRAKDEFLAMLGHELRNPLSPILTALELMRLRDDGALKRERGLIERQVDHLARLVDDLLDVSRITQGKIELRRRPIELSEIVAQAVETASPLLEERRHRLQTDVPARGLAVLADEGRLTQVVTNLLTNAAKYTDPGGSIEIAAHAEEGMAVLSVRDSGIGIGPELLPKVFDLFAQGGQTSERARGGMGLGLSLVRSLVELHGGSVEARSDGPGAGSEFTVRVPLGAGGKDEGVPRPRANGAAVRADAPTVLVVDDNTDAAESLADALGLAGYRAVAAADGPAALELAAAARPAIALLDIGLPGMDGYELAGRLRELPGLDALPLVAVTGYGLPADRDRALRAGFDRHLVKPVALDRVLGTVEELLGEER